MKTLEERKTMLEEAIKNDLFFNFIESKFDDEIKKGIHYIELDFKNFNSYQKEKIFSIIEKYKEKGFKIKHTGGGYIISLY